MNTITTTCVVGLEQDGIIWMGADSAGVAGYQLHIRADEKVFKNKEYIMPSCNKYTISIVEKYKGEEWFCSEKEAKKAGYVKSKNCK